MRFLILDARERFYYFIILLVVALRNFTEYEWNLGKCVDMFTSIVHKEEYSNVYAVFVRPWTLRCSLLDLKMEFAWKRCDKKHSSVTWYLFFTIFSSETLLNFPTYRDINRLIIPVFRFTSLHTHCITLSLLFLSSQNMLTLHSFHLLCLWWVPSSLLIGSNMRSSQSSTIYNRK